MPQLSLFETTEGVLADDHLGRITYVPRLVSAEVARSWFDELRAVAPWHAERRMMYDREVDVPRLMASFPLPRHESARASLPAAIRGAAAAVASKTDAPFTSVGLNLYRDGRDSVAPHNDHLDEIAEGFPIGLVSLGATRRMAIRAKAAKRRVLLVDLEPGSLLLMSYETQLHYTHGIPKTNEPVGERISLAFRVRPHEPVKPRGRTIYD
jgi:alkylated DNA repair dioxygenase AlkB